MCAAALLTAGIAQQSLCSAAGNIPLGAANVVNSGQSPRDDSGETGYTVGDGNDAIPAAAPTLPVTLPNKVVVRLTGVGDSQSSPISSLKFHSLSPGEKGRFFKFELTYPISDLTKPHDAEFAKVNAKDARSAFKKAVADYNAWYSDFYKNWQTYVPSTIYQYVPNDHLNEEYPTVQSINIGTRNINEDLEYSEAFKADRQVARVRIAVAAGPFVDLVPLVNIRSCKVNSAGLDVALASTYSMTSPSAGGYSELSLTDNLAEKHTAHAFTDFDRGIVCFGKTGNSLGAYNLRFKAMGANLEFTNTASIPNSVLKQTKTLEFIARPYYWVEFDNVSLHTAKK